MTSKAQSIPWSIKGVSAEARHVAKIRAQQAGMTIGDWLSQKILLNAKSLRTDSDAEITQAVERIDSLSTHLNLLMADMEKKSS